MPNEQLHLILLATGLPDGNHIFDAVWEKSALAAVFGLLAALGLTLAWFLHKDLKAERASHLEQLAAKDAAHLKQLNAKDDALAAANRLFQDQMKEAIQTTRDLATRQEETKTLSREVVEGLQSISNSMRNGMRAIGAQLNIPSERLKVDE